MVVHPRRRCVSGPKQVVSHHAVVCTPSLSTILQQLEVAQPGKVSCGWFLLLQPCSDSFKFFVEACIYANGLCESRQDQTAWTAYQPTAAIVSSAASLASAPTYLPQAKPLATCYGINALAMAFHQSVTVNKATSCRFTWKKHYKAALQNTTKPWPP
jgi:hypothetical protein